MSAYIAVLEYMEGPVDPQAIQTTWGYELLLLGWAGPAIVSSPSYGDPLPAILQPVIPYLGLSWLTSFAWYANPLWGWNTVLMLINRTPSLRLGLVSTALGALALQPFFIDFDDIQTASVPQTGAYLWAGAVSLPLIAALVCLRRSQHPRAAPTTVPDH